MDAIANLSAPIQRTTGSLGVFAEDLQICDDVHDSDDQDKRSVSSADSEMEPFEDYKPQIEKLLLRTDLAGFQISVLQHGYKWQNCVYALTSVEDPKEKYVLRVPVLPEIDDDGKCEDIEKDAALLGFLTGKLPVPSLKTFCSTKDNILEKPYTIQTRLSGISLNEIYDDLTYEEKVGIIDQFIKLLAKIESINFATAGTFSASADLPPLDSTVYPPISFFQEGDEAFMENPTVAFDRRGSDLRLLLLSHINGWIQKEAQEDRSFTLASLKFMLTMLDDLDNEGAFKSTPSPIILHHWDLEPRNIMVENIAGVWKIQGIIDWDGALALPRPLARRAPDWIWDFDYEGFTGYLDNDHHPKADADLDAGNMALKTYFDAKAAEKLDGYLEDAYGQGLWLRRIWTFAREGGNNAWYIDLMKELESDWKVRQDQTVEPLVSKAGMVTTFMRRVTTWLTRLSWRQSI